MINVFNREQLIKRGGNKDEVLISIESPRSEYRDQVPTEKFYDALQLRFDDATEKEQGYFVLFSIEMARKVCAFIENNFHQKKTFVIHCDAGISRSVAVGTFIRDFYGLDCKFHAIHSDEFRNIHVYNLLRRVKMGIKD